MIVVSAVMILFSGFLFYSATNKRNSQLMMPWIVSFMALHVVLVPLACITVLIILAISDVFSLELALGAIGIVLIDSGKYICACYRDIK